MFLRTSCQICGQILSTCENTDFTQDDINNYQENSYCMTVQGTGTDEDGNPITIYDGQTNLVTVKSIV